MTLSARGRANLFMLAASVLVPTIVLVILALGGKL